MWLGLCSLPNVLTLFSLPRVFLSLKAHCEPRLSLVVLFTLLSPFLVQRRPVRNSWYITTVSGAVTARAHERLDSATRGQWLLDRLAHDIRLVRATTDSSAFRNLYFQI